MNALAPCVSNMEDENTVDEIYPNLFLTNAACAPDFCARNKIDVCINLAAELSDLRFPRTTRVVCVPLHDTLNQPVLDLLLPACLFIEQCLEASQSVVVMCHMGISRSATFCVAFFMYKFRMTRQEAFREISHKRNIIWPNANFQRQLDKFYNHILLK